MLSIIVPQAAKKEVTSRLVKLAKKAGVAFTELEGTTTILVRKNGEKVRRALVCSRFTVGDFPRTNGWAFMARLEHTGAGNLVTCAPGEIAELVWRTASATCEHCGTARRRRDTFMLRGPDGETKQIGRNCLADFLMVDATQLVHLAEFVGTLGGCSDPDGESFGGGYEIPCTDHFLACVVSSIELHGFRKSSEESNTKGDASFLAGDRPSEKAYSARAAWDAGQPLDWHIERANAVREWGASLTPAETAGSDYLWNLHLACKLLGCDLGRYAGILASAPAAYDRAKGIEAKKAEAVKSAPKDALGTVGKRETFLVKFVQRSGYNNAYGGGLVCAFETAEGHRFVWFASGECPSSDDLQKVMLLTGKVKNKGERFGVPFTTLTRCSWELTELKRGSDDAPLEHVEG